MGTQNQHPAHPYVVYGNTGLAPEPTTTLEENVRDIKLANSAMRHAIALINYNKQKEELGSDEDHMIPLPCLRTSPPILCIAGEVYRYSDAEWSNAVDKATKLYISYSDN